MAKKNIPVRENTGNLEILSKHREFSLNREKTQGILLAQVVNVLILKVKDIFFFFFFFFFISEVYPGPIYRFCIKNRSSGQPSITFVSSFIITYIMMGNDMR